METQGKYVTIIEEKNALDFLEQAHFFIQQIEEKDLAWKWVVIALHGALYGFAICAIKGTDPDNIIDFNNNKKIFERLEILPDNIQKNGFPNDINIEYNQIKKQMIFKGTMSFWQRKKLLELSEDKSYQEAIQKIYGKNRRLISFDEALKRCQDPNLMNMAVLSKHLTLSAQQSKSIKMLQKVLRNNFEHYIPTMWPIELHRMPKIAIDVLDVIHFLALEIGNYVNLELREKEKIKNIIQQSKRILKDSQLYFESWKK